MVIENPVFRKEILTKMRSRQSRRVQIALAGTVMLFVFYCYYEAISYIIRYGGPNAGMDGWQIALVIQAILIWIISPALTSNTISQEKEQQTWEMLIFTLLSPREILLGKLSARLLPIFALLAAFFPFMLYCYSLSKLQANDFFCTYLIFAVWIFFLATTGLFMSWAFRKTAMAIATSYLVVFMMVIGTALVHTTMTIGQGQSETWILWLNPVRAGDALLSLNTQANSPGVILVNAITLTAIAAFLLWRMHSRFRAFSIE